MTIDTITFYWGFQMSWLNFNKIFLKRDIRHMYNMSETKYCGRPELKDEYYDDVNDEVIDFCDDEKKSHITGNIIVTRYPHDLSDRIDSLRGEDNIIMIGVEVASFDVSEDDDGITDYLHRPIFEYHYHPSKNRIAAAKDIWDNEIKTLNLKLEQKARLHISANDCACCS